MMLLVSSCATVIMILLWIRLLAIVVAIATQSLGCKAAFRLLVSLFQAMLSINRLWHDIMYRGRLL